MKNTFPGLVIFVIVSKWAPVNGLRVITTGRNSAHTCNIDRKNPLPAHSQSFCIGQFIAVYE